MTDFSQLQMFKQRDVERLFAACVYVMPMEAVQMCGWLKPETFLDERIRKFWAAVIENVKPEMSGTSQALDEVIRITLEANLSADILGWTSQTFSYSPLPYANEISRRAYIASISSKFGDLMRAIQSSDDSQVRQVIKSMSEMDTKSSFKLPDAFDIAERFAKIINSDSRSLDTFIPSLDDATGGLERQSLNVLAGLPSTGKSGLAWQIARSLAYNGKRTLFFSLEMDSANVWARAACPAVGVTWKDARAKRLTDDQKQRLLDESFKMAANFEDRIIIVGGPKDTETVWQITAQARPDLVIIDHLRKLTDKHPSGEVKRQGMIAERVKDVAANFECAALLIAQLHRLPLGQRPQLSDLRDSGEIEETADTVMMLYADEINGKISKRPTELWVRKNRDGQRDMLVNLIYDTRMQWFEGVQK